MTSGGASRGVSSSSSSMIDTVGMGGGAVVVDGLLTFLNLPGSHAELPYLSSLPLRCAAIEFMKKSCATCGFPVFLVGPWGPNEKLTLYDPLKGESIAVSASSASLGIDVLKRGREEVESRLPCR